MMVPARMQPDTPRRFLSDASSDGSRPHAAGQGVDFKQPAIYEYSSSCMSFGLVLRFQAYFTIFTYLVGLQEDQYFFELTVLYVRMRT